MQNQNIIEHFHWGHFGAVLFCAVFLVSITVMRNGFQFMPAQSAEKKTSTYEEAKAMAEQENPELVALANGAVFPSDLGATQEQLAMLDPGLRGNVLGATTEAATPIEQIFTWDKLEQIKVKPLGYTDAKVVKNYSNEISRIESSYDTLSLLGNFSAGNLETLKQNRSVTPLVIGELSQIQVPKYLEEYHRYKIIYYIILQNLAEMKLGTISDEEFGSLTNIFLSVMDKMSSIRTYVEDKYLVVLQ